MDVDSAGNIYLKVNGRTMEAPDTTITFAGRDNSGNIDIEIFPNPSYGIFSVTSHRYKITCLEIYNVLGKRIYKTPGNNSNFEIDFSIAEDGIYILKIIINGSPYFKKLQVIR